VDFRRVAEREDFKRGVERLVADASKYNIALMCAEKDPLQCHRTILVSRHLKKHNIHIKHILADGGIEEHTEAERRLVGMLKTEPVLFESTEIIKPGFDSLRRGEQAYDQPASGRGLAKGGQTEKICRRAKKLQNNI
jgi:hypothetical protein